MAHEGWYFAGTATRDSADILIFSHPSRFTSGRTVTLHTRLPHREHRNRFTTSASNASHPATPASVRGCALRVCPHSHVIVNTY
jgi:hypothetical protein